MPKTTKGGKVIKSELPSTLTRSDDKAQRTYAKEHDSAAETYDGDEEWAARGALATSGELPSTLTRSDDKAQRTYAKAHDSAAETYDGDEERANRVAFSALKHTHEKVGDHWEPKEDKGPSDAQAEGGADTDRPTAGGVDANASKKHLLDLARRLDVPGRSRMSKAELVEALQKANDRESRRAREGRAGLRGGCVLQRPAGP